MATPIGNLGDVTLRAMDVLRSVDAIAAEDTRVSMKLLNRFGIRAHMIPAHEHNEREAADKVVGLLATGKSVALVTDAGTPALSDPGALVVARVRSEGYRVVPVPGASAVMAALAVSGLPDTAFCFHGFLPARKGERAQALSALKQHRGLQVFFEGPHRIVDCVDALATVFGASRRIVIARELTKLFEQVHACRLGEAADWLAADDDRRRGEFVLVVEGYIEDADAPRGGEEDRVLRVLLEELPLKQAVSLAHEITGAKRNMLYDRALAIRDGN